MQPLARRSDALRLIAMRLAVPTLETTARMPGIGEAYRVTIQHHDARSPDQVATLTLGQSLAGQTALTVWYRRTADKPLALTPLIPIERVRLLTAGLRALGFDRLDDMPDLPWRGADLWLVERAVGTFYRDLVLAPDTAKGPYATIVSLLNTHLHEAIRPMNPTA